MIIGRLQIQLDNMPIVEHFRSLILLEGKYALFLCIAKITSQNFMGYLSSDKILDRVLVLYGALRWLTLFLMANVQAVTRYILRQKISQHRYTVCPPWAMASRTVFEGKCGEGLTQTQNIYTRYIYQIYIYQYIYTRQTQPKKEYSLATSTAEQLLRHFCGTSWFLARLASSGLNQVRIFKFSASYCSLDQGIARFGQFFRCWV